MAEVNTTEEQWLDKLCDEITEKLSDPKKLKFNTHKNRKLFTSEICGMIRDSINKNTMPIPPKPIRGADAAVTRFNPNAKQQGFSVMTKELSEKGDERTFEEKAAEQKLSVHKW